MPKPLSCHQPSNADQAHLYELLIDELTDFAVFLIDPAGCIVTWNPGVERLLGYTEEDWIGQPAKIIFTPEDQAIRQPERELARAARENRAPDIRWHRKKDGGRIFVEGTMVALKDAQGQLLGFSKVMRDVTARKQSEDELRESQHQLQALVHASSDVLYRMSPDWAEMLQLGGGGFLQDTPRPEKKWLEKYIHPEDRPRVLQSIEDAILNKAVFALEHRVERVDGTLGWIHSRAVPILDERGEITEWFGAATDITARKRGEEALRRSNEDLQRFGYVVSHDLQEPLRQVTVYSQLIARESGSATAKAAEYSRFVMDGTRRMESLIRGLLQMAEPDTELALECVDVSEIFHETLTTFEQMLRDTNGQVTLDTALPKLVASRLVLSQVFQNLLSNAIRYRFPGRPPEIRIRADRQANEWAFSVSDNGQGIAPGHQERIFEWFSRVPGTNAAGMGVGLANIHRMLERAGGRIRFESREREGTTFYFSLPVVKESVNC